MPQGPIPVWPSNTTASSTKNTNVTVAQDTVAQRALPANPARVGWTAFVVSGSGSDWFWYDSTVNNSGMPGIPITEMGFSYGQFTGGAAPVWQGENWLSGTAGDVVTMVELLAP